MKFMLIIDTPSEEITVVTQDGGIACIRYAEPCSETPLRVATTDYYQTRITQLEDPTADNVWELLAEGKMYANDWNKEYNSLELIQDALNWLCLGEENWEICDNLFPEIFNPELVEPDIT